MQAIVTPRLRHVPARTKMRLSRAAAVKDGPSLGPPGGLVLDGREHDGRLMRAGMVRMMALVNDGREIAERRMTPTRIVEAFDEIEDDDPCFGLRLEPAPLEELAFEGSKEALAHGVVISVSDRAH